MTKSSDGKQYDLEDRTEAFARDVRAFVRELPTTVSNVEDVKQVIRSSGSVASNYIEANEALSKKDFLMRIRICRKEAKESGLWLRLLNTGEGETLEGRRRDLTQEAHELTCIFGSIVTKNE